MAGSPTLEASAARPRCVRSLAHPPGRSASEPLYRRGTTQALNPDKFEWAKSTRDQHNFSQPDS